MCFHKPLQNIKNYIYPKQMKMLNYKIQYKRLPKIEVEFKESRKF